MSHARHIRERGRKQALRAATAAGMSLLVVAPAVAIAASADATTVSASSVANHVSGRNLVVNGSFEHGKLHWKKPATKKVKLKIKTRVATATKYARVTTTAARNVTLKTTAPVVSTATKGDVFHVSAQVRTNRPKVSGSVRAIETKGTSTRAVPEYFTLTRTAWTTVGFDVTATMTGSTFTTSVKSFNLPKGTTFDVDNVKVVKTQSAPPPTTPAPAGWSLQYSSTFKDLAGWTVYNNQTQNNDHSVNMAGNVTAGANGLSIVSKRESGYSQPFTSGELVGHSTGLVVPNYFRAEVTGTFKDESGVWPCLLWFRPENASDGEIDLMEWMGGMWTGDQKRVAVTMHNEYTSGVHDPIKTPLLLKSNSWFDPAVAHTYTLEKVPGKITVWIDGHLVGTASAANKSWWNRIMEVPGRTWYPRITSQIGQGSATQVVPDPASSWSKTEMKVTSLKLWKQG